MPSGVHVIAGNDIGTLPRLARLSSPQQFQNTFSHGRRINAALFRLHVRLHLPLPRVTENPLPNAAKPFNARRALRAKDDANATARLGISVSKRVAAQAVERNRIKRIARESFRRQRLLLPPGDYVLLAQRDAANASSKALSEGLAALWQRARALKPAPAAPTMPAHAAIDGVPL